MKARDFKNAWRQLEPRIRSHYDKLTDEDMHRIRGDKDEFLKCVEERYGKNRRQALSELNHFLEGQHAKA